MNIFYRTAEDVDIDFCEKLHHQGMRPYVEPIWGWDQDFQHSRYKRLWVPKNIQIFSLDGKEIGYFETHEIDGCLKLDNIFVEEDLRGNGIGEKVILELLEKNKTKYKKIILNVLHNNPASKLYKKVGFKFVKVNDQIHEYEFLFG